MEKNSPDKASETRANALLCPVCCVEYIEVELDFEVDGQILYNVKALQCPQCLEEAFSPEQHEAIKKRIETQNPV